MQFIWAHSDLSDQSFQHHCNSSRHVVNSACLPFKIYTIFTSKPYHIFPITPMRFDLNGKAWPCTQLWLFSIATATSLLGFCLYNIIFLEAFYFQLYLVFAEFEICLSFTEGSFWFLPSFTRLRRKGIESQQEIEKKKSQCDSKSQRY